MYLKIIKVKQQIICKAQEFDLSGKVICHVSSFVDLLLSTFKHRNSYSTNSKSRIKALWREAYFTRSCCCLQDTRGQDSRWTPGWIEQLWLLREERLCKDYWLISHSLANWEAFNPWIQKGEDLGTQWPPKKNAMHWSFHTSRIHSLLIIKISSNTHNICGSYARTHASLLLDGVRHLKSRNL